MTQEVGVRETSNALPVPEISGIAFATAGQSASGSEAELRQELMQLRQQLASGQQEMAALQAELSRTQRMDLVGQLAGGVAHDFNNVLFVIGLNLSQLSQASADPRVDKHVAMIRQGLDQAARTAAELMNFSARQPEAPRHYATERLLDELAPMLRQAAGEDSEFRLLKEAGLGSVHVDRTQFENALINLVLNARDALVGDGRIDIGASPVRTDYMGMEREFVRIEVKDNGVGMSEATLLRAFEPFFTTKPPGQGTGLGMGMVKRFVTQAGGFVQVASEEGRGTAVHLFLPMVVEAVSGS